MNLRSAVVVCICLFFISCFGLFDSGSDHIAGDYYLIWIDTHRNRSINKKDGEGVVPETVFAVGHDDRFIYAKQVPYYWSRDSVVPDSINYYVIERTDNFVQDKPVYGPLSKKSFDSLCRVLNISKVKFEIDYSEILKAW
jgi:hypothetical protein